MPKRKDTPKALKPKPLLELIPLKPGVGEEPTQLPILLRIQVPQPETQNEHPPLNLAFVLDTSGSMADANKINFAKKAVLYALKALRPKDRVAVVVFNDEVQVLQPSTQATNLEGLAQAISQLKAQGSTALHAGWLEGATQVATHLEPGRLNRVILLSDGQANRGLTDPSIIAEQVRGLAERGVSTSTLGVGTDYNEKLMVAMAQAGQGNYYFIESPEDLPGIFGLELHGLSATQGVQVRLSLSASKGSHLRLLHDLPQGGEGAYLLPPLLAGRRLEYLLELTTPGGAASVEVRLHYHRPEGGEEVQEARLEIPALPPEALSALPPHPAVKAMMARVRATQLRKAAMEALWEGDLATFQRLIDGALAEAEEEEREELEKLREEGLRFPNRASKFLSSQYFTSSRGEA